jgi:phosphoenolpyruvate carboxylase
MFAVKVFSTNRADVREKERIYAERVLTRYRLYSGLFLGLPFEKLQRTAQMLPVFEEHCRRLLEQGVAPMDIVDRFFDETPLLKDFERSDVEFLFLQLLERQIVLFDALEDVNFAQTYEPDAPGSVNHLCEIVARDDSSSRLAALLNATGTRIVLTAHPTQFYPETVQGIIGDLREALHERDSAKVERLLLQLGKTRFTNRSRPTPVEEAARLLDVVADVFYEVMPAITTRVLVAAFGREKFTSNLPATANLQIGFWPGGDRDGNPFVTAEVTAEVARLLKHRVLASYVESATALARRLTFEGAYDATNGLIAKLRSTLSAAEKNEVDDNATPAYYRDADEVMKDLFALRELVLTRHQGLFVEEIDELIVRVHLFGFHFASLDIRQNSDVFFLTLNELVKAGVFKHLISVGEGSTVEWSLELLERLLSVEFELSAETMSQLSTLARDTLSTLRLIPSIQQRNGVNGLHRVIISHAHCPEDVLAVVALSHVSGLRSTSLEIDVVPLFESIEDLESSRSVMSKLLESRVYRAHLARRGNRQTVMVGFSDGTKDGGYLTANLAIRDAKRQLTELGRQHHIEMVFFDGRGGPPARGGGNTHRFYRSYDSGIEQRHIQLTIQGQTINTNFGSYKLAKHHVEQLFTANLENLLWPITEDDPPRKYQATLDELSALAKRCYRTLRDEPSFVEFLANYSPLPLFDHLTIGSRPVSRKRSEGLELEHLRAIPFVATWSVMKMQVPGFYGLGTALDTLIAQGRESELRDLYRDSRFFRALLDNAAMSLLKSNFDVNAHWLNDIHYSSFYRMILEEYNRSIQAILRVSGQVHLLANDPINRMSIDARERIVLPLLVIVQTVYLRYLKQKRAGTESTPAAKLLRKLSLKGIAAIINATRNAA